MLLPGIDATLFYRIADLFLEVSFPGPENGFYPVCRAARAASCRAVGPGMKTAKDPCRGEPRPGLHPVGSGRRKGDCTRRKPKRRAHTPNRAMPGPPGARRRHGTKTARAVHLPARRDSADAFSRASPAPGGSSGFPRRCFSPRWRTRAVCGPGHGTPLRERPPQGLPSGGTRPDRRSCRTGQGIL